MKRQKNSELAASARDTTIWSKDAVHQKRQWISPPFQERNKIRPSSCRDALIIRKSSRHDHSHGTQLDCNQKSQADARYNELFPIKWRELSPKQWRHPNKLKDHQSSDVISGRSWAGCIIHWRQGRSLPTTDPRWDGTPPIKDAYPDHQQDSGGSNKKQNTAKMHQSHGHAIPLATWLWSPKSIQNLLAVGGDQPRGLLYQASSTGASCQRESRIPHKSQRSGRSQTCQKHQTDHKHKWQNRYATRVC